MTFPSFPRFTSSWVALCGGGLLGLSSLLITAPSPAQTWGRPAYVPPPVWGGSAPVPGPQPLGPSRGYGHRWVNPGPNDETVYDSDPDAWALTEAQLNQRCNIGRLVGGLVGGGVGYATSRQDGRSWAVPLGALLGSQMGCNVGAGRGPVPW